VSFFRFQVLRVKDAKAGNGTLIPETSNLKNEREAMRNACDRSHHPADQRVPLIKTSRCRMTPGGIYWLINVDSSAALLIH
jgi:hypothetical protein